MPVLNQLSIREFEALSTNQQWYRIFNSVNDNQTMPSVKFESLSFDQQLYLVLKAFDPSTTLTQEEFSGYFTRDQQFYRILKAVNPIHLITQRAFVSLTREQQLFLISEAIFPNQTILTSRHFEALNPNQQRFYLYNPLPPPIPGVERFIDAAAVGAGDGTSWADAWTDVTQITGLVDTGGNIVNFAGGSYEINDWTPAGGTVTNPNIYRVAQDGTHSTTVNFNASGTKFLAGAVQNVVIDGRFEDQMLFALDPAFEYFMYDPGFGPAMSRVSIFGCIIGSIGVCYGAFIEIAFNSISSPLAGLDDSLIQHIGERIAPGWGQNKIHHNIITVKRLKLTGSGWDAIKWGHGMDIHDNIFRAVFDAGYAGSQHNDAIQASGNYIRVYNNYFENFISYVWLNEIFDSSQAAHYRFFNNTVFYSDEAGVDWTAQFILAFGGNEDTQPDASLTDFIIANNTFIGIPPGIKGCLICHLSPAIHPAVGADCYFVNNAANNFSPVGQVGAGILSNNISDPSVAEVDTLALYPTGDLHPTALSIAIINAGVNPAPSYLTNEFTTDADGVARANPWDLGAYVSDFPPPTSVTDTFSLLADSSNFSDINPPGWTLHTGNFRTGSGGTSQMVTGNVAAIISVASYEPAGFTTDADHTVEVTMGAAAGTSNAQGAACAIQADGACYHIFTDGAGTIFFGIADGAGAGSDYLNTIAPGVQKLRIVVAGSGALRTVTASYDNGSGYVTPPGWSKVFAVILEGGKGGIAGFNNAAAQYIDSVTITNN